MKKKRPMDETSQRRTLSSLYNDSGIAVFYEDTLFLLPEIRKRYPIDGEEAEIIETIFRKYSSFKADDSGEEKMPLILRDLLRCMNGSPVQDYLYNSVIYNMDVENWPKEEQRERGYIFRALSSAFSRLYLDQSRLNTCIGRPVYVSEEIDIELSFCICHEMSARFPFIYELIRGSGKVIYTQNIIIRDYVNKHFYNHNDEDRYFKAFVSKIFFDNIQPGLAPHGRTRFRSNGHSFQTTAAKALLENKRKANPISSQSAFWNCISGRRPADSNNFLLDSGGDIPTKDDIYVLCVACGFSQSVFELLVKAAKDDLCDSTVYANNKENFRDEHIQNYIRDLDTSYRRAYADKYNLSWDKLAQTEINRYDDLIPLRVLIMLDGMLYNNIKHYSDAPQNFLLYHNFMMNSRKSEEYVRLYNQFQKEYVDSGTVIDFEYEYLKYREKKQNEEKR